MMACLSNRATTEWYVYALAYERDARECRHVGRTVAKISFLNKKLTAGQIRDAFANLRKSTTSFIMSVCPSIRPHGTTRVSLDGFSRNLVFWLFFDNLSRKFKFHWNLSRIPYILREDQENVFIIHHLVLLRLRNFSDKSCRENQNTFYVLNLFRG